MSTAETNITNQSNKFMLESSSNRFGINCENREECGGWCYVMTFGLWDEKGFKQGVQLAFPYIDSHAIYFASYVNHNLSCQWTKLC